MVQKTHLAKQQNDVKEVGVQIRNDGLHTEIDKQLCFDPSSKELTFNDNGTVYQMNLRVLTSDPVSPKEKEAWIHDGASEIRYVMNGVIKAIALGGGSEQPTNQSGTYYYRILTEAELSELADININYPNSMIQTFDKIPEKALTTDILINNSSAKVKEELASGNYKQSKRNTIMPNYSEGVVVTTAQGLAPFNIVDNGDGTTSFYFYNHIEADFMGYTKFWMYEEEVIEDETVQAFYKLDTEGRPLGLPVISITEGVGTEGDETVMTVSNSGLDLTMGIIASDYHKKLRVIPKAVAVFAGAKGILPGTEEYTELQEVEASATKFKRILGEEVYTKLEHSVKGTVRDLIIQRSPNNQYVIILAKISEEGIANGNSTTRAWYSTDGMKTITYDENFKSDWGSGTYASNRYTSWTTGYENDFHEDMVKINNEGHLVFGHYYAAPSSYHQAVFWHGWIGNSGLNVTMIPSCGGYVGVPWSSTGVHIYQNVIDVDWDSGTLSILNSRENDDYNIWHYQIDHSNSYPSAVYKCQHGITDYFDLQATGFIKFVDMEGERMLITVATHINWYMYGRKFRVVDILSGSGAGEALSCYSLENGNRAQSEAFHHEYTTNQMIYDWYHDENLNRLHFIVKDDYQLRYYMHDLARTRRYIYPKFSLTFDNADINSGELVINCEYDNGSVVVNELATVSAANLQSAALLKTALDAAWTYDTTVVGDIINGYEITQTYQGWANFTEQSNTLVDSGTPAYTEITKLTCVADSSVKASYNDTPTGALNVVNVVADDYGAKGNLVTVTGDGTYTVDQLVSIWNALNTTNTASVVSGGSEVPDNGVNIDLAGGDDGLDGKYFTMYDSNGSVGFYFDMTGSTPAPTGLDRVVAITTALRENSDNLIAISVADALQNDSEYSASSSLNEVTASHNTAGDFLDGETNNSGFTVVVDPQGVDAIPPAQVTPTFTEIDLGQTARWFYQDNTARDGMLYGNDNEEVCCHLLVGDEHNWTDYFGAATDYAHDNNWGAMYGRGNILQVKDHTLYLCIQGSALNNDYDVRTQKIIKVPDYRECYGWGNVYNVRSANTGSPLEIGNSNRGTQFGDMFAQKIDLSSYGTQATRYPDGLIPLRTLRVYMRKNYGTYARYGNHNMLTAKIVGMLPDGSPDMGNVLGETTTKLHARGVSGYDDFKYHYFNFDDVRCSVTGDYFIVFGADATVWNPTAEDIEDQGRMQIGGNTETNTDLFYRWDGTQWVHEDRYMNCSFFDFYLGDVHRAAGMHDLRLYTDFENYWAMEIAMGSFGKVNDDKYTISFRHMGRAQTNSSTNTGHGHSGKQYVLTMTDDLANKYKFPQFTYPKPLGYTEAEHDNYLRFQIAMGREDTRRIETNLEYSDDGGTNKYYNEVPQFGGMHFSGASSTNLHRRIEDTGDQNIGVYEDSRFKYGVATKMGGNRLYFDYYADGQLPYSEDFLIESEFEADSVDLDNSHNMIGTIFRLGYWGINNNKYHFFFNKFPNASTTLYSVEDAWEGYQRLRIGRDENGLIWNRSRDGVTWENITVASGNSEWLENGGVVGTNTGMTNNYIVIGGYDSNDSYNWHGAIGYFRYVVGKSYFANDEIIDQKNLMHVRNHGSYLVGLKMLQDSISALQDWNMMDLAIVRPETKTSKVSTPDMQYKVAGDIIQGTEMAMKLEMEHTENTQDPSAVQGIMLEYQRK